MSLVEGFGTRLLRAAFSAAPGLGHHTTTPMMATALQVRYKPGKGRRHGVGPTKNRFGFAPGKNRGLKVYDGQRVPAGKELIAQYWPRVFPGWNVHYGPRFYDLHASVDGRAMVTTERLEPDWDQRQIQDNFDDHHKDEKQLFKHFVHVIPDKQHQYFKLVEEV